jgi:hypothetical protein
MLMEIDLVVDVASLPTTSLADDVAWNRQDGLLRARAVG